MFRYNHTCVLALLFALISFAPSSFSNASDFPAQIRGKMLENASKLHRISIKWNRKVSDVDLKNAISTAFLHGLDRGQFEQQHFEYTQSGVKYFCHREFKSVRNGKLKEYFEEHSYDDSRRYTLKNTEKGKVPWQLIINGTDFGTFLGHQRVLQCHYLESIGYAVPNALEMHGKVSVEPLLMYAKKNGADISITNGGVDAPILDVSLNWKSETGSFLPGTEVHEFRLAREYSYCPVSWEIKDGNGRLVENRTFEDFRNFDGAWVPFRAITKFYQYKGQPSVPKSNPIMEERLELTSLQEFIGNDSVFSLKCDSPGTIIMDASMPEAKQSKHGYIVYSVPADASQLDRVIRNAILKSGSSIQASHRYPSYLWIFLGVSLVVIVGYVLWKNVPLRTNRR